MRWAALVLALFSIAATRSVVDFGAVGDCQQFYVETTASSTTVVTTNSLGASGINRTMQIFGAGALGSYAFSSSYPETSTTNNQDLCVAISGVSGFNVTISQAASKTGTFLCTYGTNNAPVFQHVVNLSTNGDTVSIPAGNYLLISSSNLNPNSVLSNYAYAPVAVYLSKGGITFQGEGTNNTRLTGVGAWQNRTNIQHITLIPGQDVMSGMRGIIIGHTGPVTNDHSPTVYDGITFDGGVLDGQTGYDYFPVLVSNGDGWDVTHGAIIEHGTVPLQGEVIIQNCAFTKFRGEILKSVVPLTDGYRTITNCWFVDGNASANNFSFSHRVVNCYFDTLKTAQEFYQGYSTQPSFFIGSRLTNITGVTGGGQGIVIGGSEVGVVAPKYTIFNNDISAQNGGVLLSPVQNLDILTNIFRTSVVGVNFSGASYQGTTNTWGVNIYGNRMTNVFIGVSSSGADASSVYSVNVFGNIMKFPGGSSQFASGSGWNTNMFFKGNISDGVAFGLYGGSLQGQYFIDLGNSLPWFEYNDAVGVANSISYKYGGLQVIQTAHASSTWLLDSSSPLKIPNRAYMIVSNDTASAKTVAINPWQSTNIASDSAFYAYWSETRQMWFLEPRSIVRSNLNVGGNLIFTP